MKIYSELWAAFVLFGESATECFDSLMQGFLRNIWNETYHGIQIEGSYDFVKRTKQALDALMKTPYFTIVNDYIRVVKESRRLSMNNKAGFKASSFHKPTCIVGHAMWNELTAYYASVIAHEAYHGYLYARARTKSRFKLVWPGDYAGAKAEKQCYEFQLKVLLSLKADSYICARVNQCIDDLPSFYKRRGLAKWLE